MTPKWTIWLDERGGDDIPHPVTYPQAIRRIFLPICLFFSDIPALKPVWKNPVQPLQQTGHEIAKIQRPRFIHIQTYLQSSAYTFL
jgi:hypothetical protein